MAAVRSGGGAGQNQGAPARAGDAGEPWPQAPAPLGREGVWSRDAMPWKWISKGLTTTIKV